MFDRVETGLEGCFVLRLRPFEDSRGVFVKSFHAERFSQLGLETGMVETFWSASQMGVVRGLHYQRPPHDHAKLVACLTGEIFDVVVDLRSSSPTFGRHFSVPLSPGISAVYIPRGCAHGFQATAQDSLVLYQTTSLHDPAADTGIRWDSCGITWPLPALLSPRDQSFPEFASYRATPEFP